MQENQSTSEKRQNPKGVGRKIWGFLPTLVFILLIGVIVMLFGMIKTQAEASKEEKTKALRHDLAKTNVVAMELIPGPVQDRLNLPGVVRPWVEIDAVAEVNGIIADKKVQLGQYVKTGDVLAMIDDRDYQNSFISAKAAYQAADTSFRRLNELLKNKAVAQAQVDEARAHLETSRAAMANAQLRLDRTVIRSPLTGVVDQTFIEAGQYVNPGQEIAKILQIDKVKVEVGIPESDVDAVRQVKHFQVIIDALGGKRFKGEFNFLARSATNMARLYNLEITVANPDGEILPDMFTRVDIIKKEVSDGLTVPLFSLIKRQDGRQAVYLAEGGTVRLQEVEVGIQEGWQVQITKGVSAGDKVVVVGHRNLNDGGAVNVVRTVRDLKELDI